MCILSIVSRYLVLVVSVELHLYFLIQIQKRYIFVKDAYPFSAAFFYKYLPPQGPSSATVIFVFHTVFGSDRIGP